ncbi:MAG: 50S ribosomal protein L22 [Deinococcota bacterium]
MSDVVSNVEVAKRQAKAHLHMIRITPQKTRLVADLVRGCDVEKAEDILRFTPRRAAQPILKLLQSAKANAVNNHDMFEDSLFVSKIMVDEGPTLKRYLPRARGRADLLRKRTSHITIVLEERDE